LVLLRRIVDPQLGGDEQLCARHATRLQRTADGGFVAVTGRRVDVPVAHAQRLEHGRFALGVGHLVHAEAEDRHLHAVG
jgi:hypothetical protein